MISAAASAIRARLRALHRPGTPAAGVYYRDGVDEWVYVPPGVHMVPVEPEGAGLSSPTWMVRVLVISADVSHDEHAPARWESYAAIDLHPAAMLNVDQDVVDKITRRARQFITSAIQ